MVGVPTVPADPAAELLTLPVSARRRRRRAVRLAEAGNVENERHDIQAIMRRVIRRMAAMGHDDPDPDEVERRAYEEIATMRKRRLAAAS